MNIRNYKELSIKDIIQILSEEKVCYLTTTDTNNIESVPMWYVFDYLNSNLVFYFISDNSAQKIDNIYYTGIAGITLTQHHIYKKIELYKTILANGSTSIITDIKEKIDLIERFKSKYNLTKIFFFDNGSNIEFIKVNISEIHGREYS